MSFSPYGPCGFVPPVYPFMCNVYGFPLPLVPGLYGHLDKGDCPEEYEFSKFNERTPRWLHKMQRAGMAGPMLPDPYSDTGIAIVAPWAAPFGWEPKGGFYGDPVRKMRGERMRRELIADGTEDANGDFD